MIEGIRTTRQTIAYMDTDMPDVELTDKEKKAWQELSYLVRFSQVFEGYAKENKTLSVRALNFLIHWAAVVSFMFFDLDNYVHRYEKEMSNLHSELERIEDVGEKPKKRQSQWSSSGMEQSQREDTSEPLPQSEKAKRNLG